jgi:hypothetical protein
MASAHWLKEHRMLRMSHSLYSPGLAPNDFSLFPLVRQKLESIQVVDNDELFNGLKEFLTGIDQEELTWVLQA